MLSIKLLAQLQTSKLKVQPVIYQFRSCSIVSYDTFADRKEFCSNTTFSPRQAWVENLNTTHSEKVGLINLHPTIFAHVPNFDVIQRNLSWQTTYRKVNYAEPPSFHEHRGTGKKPWPQKGTGRARAGSSKASHWIGGCSVHGPRRYTCKFYMLSEISRLKGLISVLSAKFAQNDLVIVNSLDLPTADSTYIENLVEHRFWGPSVLFSDVEHEFPKNITLATDQIHHMNMLPYYGLNCYGMLKHETLVLTVAAVKLIEERLLHCLHRPGAGNNNLLKYKQFDTLTKPNYSDTLRD